MAGTATAHKLTELEEAIAHLARVQARTESNLDRYAAEMRERQARTEANLDRHIADLAAENKKAMRAAGEAVRRAGRLVEDIVGPSIAEFFRSTFDWPGPIESAMRLSRTARSKPSEERDFDGFVAGGDTFLLVSVKSTVSPKSIDELLADMASVRDFFPETQDRKVHGAMASLYIDSSLVTRGEREGLLMLGLEPGLVTALNSPAFRPRAF